MCRSLPCLSFLLFLGYGTRKPVASGAGIVFSRLWILSGGTQFAWGHDSLQHHYCTICMVTVSNLHRWLVTIPVRIRNIIIGFKSGRIPYMVHRCNLSTLYPFSGGTEWDSSVEQWPGSCGSLQHSSLYYWHPLVRVGYHTRDGEA